MLCTVDPVLSIRLTVPIRAILLFGLNLTVMEHAVLGASVAFEQVSAGFENVAPNRLLTVLVPNVKAEELVLVTVTTAFVCVPGALVPKFSVDVPETVVSVTPAGAFKANENCTPLPESSTGEPITTPPVLVKVSWAFTAPPGAVGRNARLTVQELPAVKLKLAVIGHDPPPINGRTNCAGTLNEMPVAVVVCVLRTVIVWELLVVPTRTLPKAKDFGLTQTPGVPGISMAPISGEQP